jgi:hypothetical protein
MAEAKAQSGVDSVFGLHAANHTGHTGHPN